MSALPELPEAANIKISCVYSASQMREYGELCRKQALEESKIAVMAWLKSECEDTRNIDEILESLK